MCSGCPQLPYKNQERPRQTKPKKGQFMNFSQGHSGTKVQYESCLCCQGKTPEFTKMGEIHVGCGRNGCFGGFPILWKVLYFPGMLFLLLTVGSFLLTVELFRLQLTILAFGPFLFWFAGATLERRAFLCTVYTETHELVF